MGGVEVVLGGEHLVARRQPDARVQQPESHRGRVGERDLVRAGLAGTAAAAVNTAVVQLRLVGEEVAVRVGVQPGPVPLDRRADGGGVAGEVERGEVRRRRVEHELGPHARPVVGVERRRGAARAVAGGSSVHAAVAVATAAPTVARSRPRRVTTRTAGGHASSVGTRASPRRSVRAAGQSGNGVSSGAWRATASPLERPVSRRRTHGARCWRAQRASCARAATHDRRCAGSGRSSHAASRLDARARPGRGRRPGGARPGPGAAGPRSTVAGCGTPRRARGRPGWRRAARRPRRRPG